MKLHLPKLLLAAVMSVMVAGQHTAWGAITQVEGTPVGGVTPVTVTISGNQTLINLDSYNNTTEKSYTLIFNLNSSGTNHLTNSDTSTDAAIQIGTEAGKGFYMTDGYSNDRTYTFSGAVSGTGEFALGGSITKQYYKFTGDMSQYSGNMTLRQDASSKFIFSENTSGTGTITALGDNTVEVIDATMNNSSINVGNLSVAGTSSFAGDVTAGAITLGENADVTIAAGKTLTISDAIGGTSGTLRFGEGAKIVCSTVIYEPVTLEHDTFGYGTGLDLLAGDLTVDAPVAVTLANGTSTTMKTDGSVDDWEDNNYYIRGTVNSSAINVTNDDLSEATAVRLDKAASLLNVDEDITLPNLQASQGKITLTKNLSLTGTSSITSTVVSGSGELIVSAGTLTVSGSNTRNLQSNMRIQSGATLTFASGYDTIDYGQTRTIYVDGTMDVGTTRQTVGNWNFELTGGTIKGTGQKVSNNPVLYVGLDFHSASTITAKAATGATAAAPTASTISTKVRYNGALTISVEENALLDMTGGIVAGNKLTKNGVGTLRLANNDNNYGDKAFDVTGGKLELRDNTVTMNGAVTVSNGAALLLKQSATGANTLANVTLNNGSLLVQNSAGKNTTNITKLTVGSNGATIGTELDTSFGNNSHNGNIAIGSLVASTTEESTISFVNSSNTSAETTVYINGGPGANEKAFKGTVKVLTASTNANRRIDLDLASDTALANAVVELGGGTGDKTSYTTNLVLGSATTAVKGIKDAADRKSAGNVIIRDGDYPSTLTINTAGNDYTTKSGVKEHISLVKSGEGKQSFSGDMSAFDGAITVNEGTLEFLKASTTLNVTELTVAGGDLTVNGTVNTGSKLSYTSGTIDANLNVKTGTALTLNGTVDMEGILTLGDSLTLNGSKLTDILGLTEGGKVELFNGVTSLTLGGHTYTAGSLTEDNGLAFGEVFSYAAPMSNATTGELYLGFDANGVVFAGMSNIPEPTTATLSLLALAGLAARRRRK